MKNLKKTTTLLIVLVLFICYQLIAHSDKSDGNDVPQKQKKLNTRHYSKWQ